MPLMRIKNKRFASQLGRKVVFWILILFVEDQSFSWKCIESSEIILTLWRYQLLGKYSGQFLLVRLSFA